jgi:hypothetical protein
MSIGPIVLFFIMAVPVLVSPKVFLFLIDRKFGYLVLAWSVFLGIGVWTVMGFGFSPGHLSRLPHLREY